MTPADLSRLESLAREATPQYFQDEIDAAHAATDWFQAIIDAIPRDDRRVLEMRHYQFASDRGAQPCGGLQTLWNDDKVIAQATLVRTAFNNTALTLHQPAAVLALIERVRETDAEADNAWRTAHRWEHEARLNQTRLSAVMDELDRWKQQYEALASSVAKAYSNQPVVYFVADDEATRIRKEHAAAMRGGET